MGKVFANCNSGSSQGDAWVWVMDSNNALLMLSEDGGEPTSLPAGTYVLHWDFRGNPGDAVTITVNSAPPNSKQLCTTGSQTIPAGTTKVGSDAPERQSKYKDVSFTV